MLFLANRFKKSFFLASFIFFSHFLSAQCFEIESILVDACGTVEGENEMVRFRVANAPLNTANLNVSWANTVNPWLGICQNATTANAVAALNATIQGCGLLIEPTAGILPINAKVLLITSTAIDVNANSFASLSDTLYTIFQCAGNTSGHFSNWVTTPGLRTLTMWFSIPSNCSDTVTYDRALLVNQNGTIGGSAAIRDGALANFDDFGNVSYENFGCQAPFIPGNVTISALSATVICPGNAIQLFTSPSSSITNLNWTGNNGTFNSTTNDTVTYTSSINDTSNFYIIIEGTSVCGTVKDSVLITVNPPSAAIQNVQICAGETFTLPSGLIVNTTGTFIDTLFGAAPLGCDSIITTNLTVNNLPNVTANASPSTTICLGNSVTLIGSGASAYTWDNGVTNGVAFSPVLGSTLYTVTGIDANNCTNTDTITINTINCVNLIASFVPSSLVICQGESITFTDNSIGAITNWNWTFNGGNPLSATTQGAHNIVFNSAGNFNIILQVTDANGTDDTTIAITVLPTLTTTQNLNECQGFSITVGSNNYSTTGVFTDTLTSITTGCDSIVTTNLTINQPISVQIIENDTVICQNDLINGFVLHTIGGINLSWNTGQLNIDSLLVTQEGIYTVTSNNNGCVITDNIQITIDDCIEPTLFIPNVFTPNNDGLNDIFKAKGSFIENFEATIFNRWGKEIYNWKDVNEGWNGKYEGTLVVDGTYFYIIDVVFLDKIKKNFTGAVMLLK